MNKGRTMGIARTKLSVFCDRMIEAGILTTAVVIPLFFNPYNWTIFEPDKSILLRSITLLIALAWGVKLLEEGHWQEWGRQNVLKFFQLPLVGPALIFLGIYLLSTITSIAPRLSFWGYYVRQQGTYTALAYVSLFFLTVSTLRRREQLDRLVTAILLGSLPVALYAVGQHYGLDPFPWRILWKREGEGVTLRAISTLGNPIFLAGYLIMVVPLTVGRLMELLAGVPGGGKRGIPRLVPMLSCVVLLLIQLAAILFTQSRGPLLGLAGGTFLFAFLWAITRGKRRLALGVIGAIAAPLLFLILLNLPGTPLAPLARLPYLSRLSTALNLQAWGTAERVLIWQGVSSLITAEPLRAIIGYGPETLIIVFYRHFPRALVPLVGALGKSGVDRAHNQILDNLVTAGFLGFASYMVLIGGIFYYGLKWLGLIKSSRQGAFFLGALSVGAVLGVLGPWMVDGSLRFAGVGTAAGLLIGLGIFLLTSALGRPQSAASPDLAASHLPTADLLLIALFSSLIAHFIEVQTGMAIAATSTYFWLYAAMMVVIGGCFTEEPVQEQATTATPKVGVPAGKRRKRGRDGRERPQPAVAARSQSLFGPPNTSLLVYSLLIGLILITWSYAFINKQVDLKAHGFSAIWLAGVVWYLSYWLILTVPAVTEIGRWGDRVRGRQGHRVSLSPCLLVSLHPLALPGIGLLLFLALHWPVVQRDDAAYAIFVYAFWLVLGIVAIGVILTREASLPGLIWRKANGVAYVFLAGAILALNIVTNLNVARADVYLKKATAFGLTGQWDKGLPYLQRASRLATNYNEYHKLLSKYAFESWRMDPSRDPRWLEEAREALEREAQIAPLGAESLARAGSVYLALGETAKDPSLREERLAQALKYYQQAIALSPWPADIYREWGKVYHDLARYDQAIEKYEQSLRLDDRVVDTYLALGDAYEAMGDFDRAIQAYAQAVEVDPNSVQAHNALGYEYSLKGDWEKAIQETRKAAELAPDNYLIHQNLGSYYEALGQIDQAIAEAKLAISLAPPQQKAALENALAVLEQKRAAGSAQ